MHTLLLLLLSVERMVDTLLPELKSVVSEVVEPFKAKLGEDQRQLSSIKS